MICCALSTIDYSALLESERFNVRNSTVYNFCESAVFCALHDQLASLGIHAQLTRCFSAVAELLVYIKMRPCRCCRWSANVPSRTEVQHSRPGQRCASCRSPLRSDQPRCLVVQKLQLLPPEWSLPAERRPQCHLRYKVALLEWRSLFSEIHWDEDKAVLSVNRLTS